MASSSTKSWLGIAIDAWSMGAEASMVIAMRGAKLAFGGRGAEREAQLMVAEKAEAAWDLGLAWATGSLGARPETIAHRTLEHYSKRVSANHRRLTRR